METTQHVLQNPWTFYYYQKPKNPNSDQDYSKCIQKIAKISTVEEFWAVYSHVVRPEKLRPIIQLQFFRNDSRAMWEDEENKSGGAFFLSVPKTHGNDQWEKILLGLIGDQLNKDFIGAVIGLKPDCMRLYIWNQTADINLCQQLAGELFKILELPYKTKIIYTPHSKFLTTDGSGKLITKTTYQFEADGPVVCQSGGK